MSLFKNVILSSAVADAACGTSHSLAVTSNGELYAWGRNVYGQLGVGDNTDRSSPTRVGTDSDWVSVKAGNYHSIAIKENGQIYSWGLNNLNQCGVHTSLITSTGLNTPTNSSLFNSQLASTSYGLVGVFPGYSNTVLGRRVLSGGTAGREQYYYIGSPPIYSNIAVGRGNQISHITEFMHKDSPTSGDPIINSHTMLFNDTNRILTHGYQRIGDMWDSFQRSAGARITTVSNYGYWKSAATVYRSGSGTGTRMVLKHYGTSASLTPSLAGLNSDSQAYMPHQAYGAMTPSNDDLGSIIGSNNVNLVINNSIAQTGDMSVFFISADGKLNAQISRLENQKMYTMSSSSSSHMTDQGVLTNEILLYQQSRSYHLLGRKDITTIFQRTALFDPAAGDMDGTGRTQFYDNNKIWSSVFGSRDCLFARDNAGQFYSAGSPEGNKLGRTVTTEKPANQLHPIEIPNVTKVFLGDNHNFFLQTL